MVSLIQFLCFSIQKDNVSCSLCVISPQLRSLAYLTLVLSKLSTFLPQDLCTYWSICLECPFFFF